MNAQTNPPILLYTAITAGYEQPRSDIRVFTACDLPDPRRSARRVKCLTPGFGDYAYSIWMDGNTALKVAPHFLIERFLQSADIAVFRHGQRDCIYDEAEVCGRLGLDDSTVIQAQIERYRAEGYPPHAGLAATTYVVRRHTPAIAAFNAAWWHEIEAGSKRDQLSFNYVSWKLGLLIAYFDECHFDIHKHNSYFSYREHGR